MTRRRPAWLVGTCRGQQGRLLPAAHWWRTETTHVQDRKDHDWRPATPEQAATFTPGHPDPDRAAD